MKKLKNNVSSQLRKKFPWKYLIIVRYSPSCTEDYFFIDYFDLKFFVETELVSEDLDFVIYNLDIKFYELKNYE